ncbi:hypothetical protein [Moorena sp. SIO4G3]|uniref:hypothetical protein n=1 Tax=Moorena sp. SIO4G3 TaxID=2607821 RepID=UPI0014296A5C|nr:hypothetical protein [Moorena sp. SIO4G3]NEO80041.1 hypothetical protein [Moorena sp. SIO4G3]
MKYPNLLDLWSRYANAEVGASNSQLKSGTVLFVFGISRFIRRRLNQRRRPAGIGLTQRPQADIRLPQTYNFYDRLTLELQQLCPTSWGLSLP